MKSATGKTASADPKGKPRKAPKVPRAGKAQHAAAPPAPAIQSEVMSVAEADRRYGALFAERPEAAAKPAPKPKAPKSAPVTPTVDPEAPPPVVATVTPPVTPVTVKQEEPSAADLPTDAPPPPVVAPPPSGPSARESRAARAEAERARQDHERAWVDWAVFPRFQALLEAADVALAVEPIEMRALASARRSLMEDWKALGPLPRDKATELATSLQTRLDAFSARRKAFESAEDGERAENLAKKEGLLTQAEAALSGDTRAATDALRILTASWKTIGPVPRDQMDALGNRYKAVQDRLHERRREAKAERDAASAERMEQLVRIATQAEALQGAKDPFAAAERAKALQITWKGIGPTGPREEVDVQWQRFRAACDAIFARRNEAEDIRRQANTARKEALITRARTLAEEGEVADPDTVIRGLQADWRKVGQVPRAEADALWARFKAALDAIRTPPPIDQATLGDGASSLQFQPFAALASPEDEPTEP